MRKGEKVREKERKCKRAGRAESFPLRKFINQEKRSPGYSVCLGLYTAPKQYKLPK